MERIRYSNYHICVLDNGSSQDQTPQIQKVHPKLHVIRSERNLGFSGGHNRILAEAKKMGLAWELAWFLNNDTVVDPEALGALVSAFNSNSKCGIAGSLIYFMSPPEKIWFAGGQIDLRTGKTIHRGQGETIPPTTVQPVDYVTGCSLMARRNMIERVGAWDEDFFLYREDVELCLRARTQEWQVLLVPHSIVHHKVAASTGGLSTSSAPAKAYYSTRGMWLLIFKALPNRYRIRQCGAAGISTLRTIARAFLRAEEHPLLRTFFILKGFWDFLWGRTGYYVEPTHETT